MFAYPHPGVPQPSAPAANRAPIQRVGRKPCCTPSLVQPSTGAYPHVWARGHLRCGFVVASFSSQLPAPPDRLASRAGKGPVHAAHWRPTKMELWESPHMHLGALGAASAHCTQQPRKPRWHLRYICRPPVPAAPFICVGIDWAPYQFVSLSCCCLLSTLGACTFLSVCLSPPACLVQGPSLHVHPCWCASAFTLAGTGILGWQAGCVVWFGGAGRSGGASLLKPLALRHAV